MTADQVFNYRAAMREAQAVLHELPMSQRVVCAAHRVLMAGVRGGDRAPGECRRIPVWIGPDRHDAGTARYLPINAGELPAAMGAYGVAPLAQAVSLGCAPRLVCAHCEGQRGCIHLGNTL